MSPARILVVDDTPTNIRLLAATLEPYGYVVDGAEGGEAGLGAVRAADYDLVLLDVQMPGLNGYDVCRRIREELDLPALPVVMITASLGEERALALEAGADDFVVRPFEHAELLARVRSLLRIKAYHDRLQAASAELRRTNEVLEERVAVQLAELERFHELRRFLPARVADAVLASGEEVLAPHRREVAVLTCRLHGFPALVASAEPEDGVRALRDFHDVLGRLATTCGASVGGLGGEWVTMFFNDPLPCEEPVRRAVELAVSLRRDLAPVAERWSRRGHDLGIASAVGFGYATLGMIGFEGRYDYGAVGAVVDATSELCGIAEPGEVRLSQTAHAALDPTVACRPVDASRSSWLVEEVHAPVPEASLEIRLLGPLEVHVDGVVLPVTAAKERTLLCLLAMRAGTVVDPERLADELWEGAPPETALTTLRAHLSRLRKTLGGAGAAHILVTHPTGYALDVSVEQVDAARFTAAAEAGRQQLRRKEAEAAAATLRAALELWRGPALADVAGMLAAAPEAARLEELRLLATEDRIEADLRCGRHREVLTELERLTADHPLRERFWGQRMLALHRCGRQPEALRAYQQLRAHLAEELGLEPSPELARLESDIATRSTALELHAPAS